MKETQKLKLKIQLGSIQLKKVGTQYLAKTGDIEV